MVEYKNIKFEEAARILYFMFNGNPRIYMELMVGLMNAEHPADGIAPTWYQQYKEFLADNKKSM